LHHFDAMTPVDAVMSTLDDLVRAGKVRFIGASNYSGWQLMKSLAAADRYGYSRFVANQAYYSLIGRDYEWELMPLGLDQGIGAVLHETAAFAPPVDEERLYRIVDVLDEVAAETGKTIPQIALNWLLRRPTVSTVLIGARDEKQLVENLGATGWQLEWNGQFAERTPPPVPVA
jgi:aryl-alcohol dehydrogenase-like predicted oxidoreductase